MKKLKLKLKLISSVVIIWCSLISIGSAQELTVPPNSTLVIQPSQQTLSLSKLTIGDGAIVQFEESIRYWSVSAKQVVIGSGATIDASGKTGASGNAGKSWSEANPQCGDGRHGEAATAGQAGANGVDLSFVWENASIKELTINASGGNGGNGGQGGRGEDAGFGRACLRADGGNGGSGGDAGSGGDGGTVKINLAAAESESINALINNIRVLVDAGNAGEIGKGGIAGKGSPSFISNIPTPSGRKRRTHEGDVGKTGEHGIKGNDGRPGTVAINSIMSGIAPERGVADNTASAQNNPTRETDKPLDQATSSADKDEEIRLLRHQLEALEKRLNELEQNK